MSVNPAVTRKIAHLARLQLPDAEIEQYTQELGKIIEFVEQLSAVNVEGVEPVVHGVELSAHFREDTPVPLSEEQTKKILNCSEQPLYDQYRVPQVIGGE